VHLTLEEKGYGPDEIRQRIVDLEQGENFAPAYLNINPNATVPSLVVPLEGSLAPDAPKMFRAVCDTKSILELLDKSRSVSSRTHTTSLAPAPALAPATVSLAATANEMIAILHAVPLDTLAHGAVNVEELAARVRSPEADFVRSRHAALQRYMNDEAIEAVKRVWEARLLESELILQVYEAAGKATEQLTAEEARQRQSFFERSTGAWTSARDVLARLDKDMAGPYALGDQLSLVDLHLAAWMTFLFFLAGAPPPPPIQNVLERPYTGYGMLDNTIRTHAGDPTFVLGCNIRAFWEAMKDRDSWSKVYGEGLH